MPQALPFITAGAAVYGATKGGGSKQTTSTATDPAQMAMYQDLYGRAKGIAQQPFVPYTGSRVAGFNPDQLRQFEATRGRFETGMQYDPITGLQGLAQQGAPQIGQVGSLLDADIGAYQSPYGQQVIDQTMSDIQRQADIQRGFSQDRAIGAGAFGGSRSAILEGESQRPYIEQQARTAAGLRESGFQQAQRAAESDIARQQQMAQFAPQFELNARAQQLGLLGGLSAEQGRRMSGLGQIGLQQQRLQQGALDVPYGEFERALKYSPGQLSLLSQAVYGQPQNTTTTDRTSPSFLDKASGAVDLYTTLSALI